MKKRKEQKYSTKELEEELIEFMRTKHKRYIELETYIDQTKKQIHWTQERMIALYKTVHESYVVTLSYCRDKENMIATCAIRM
ncbi:hypothetical protein R4Y59_002579 [Enterococcus faecalis]|nr:hypothetical protein [Enterococcus faecalis]